MNPRTLLETYGIDPKKSLGQNFLHDPNALQRIVAAATLTPDSIVLEVGPGTGALTQVLAPQAKQVVAVETDERMIPILEETLAEFDNVTIYHADILETSIAELVGDAAYCVVANLPYYITSAILRHLLEADHKPTHLVLTVQQEVADRIVAPPGDLSLLAVSVRFYGEAHIVTRIGSAAFWPRPDVASAVLRVDVHPKPVVEVPSEAIFFQVVRSGFGQKRKQLRNSLSAGLRCSPVQATEILTTAGIDPMRRAETLTLEEWAVLSRSAAGSTPELFLG